MPTLLRVKRLLSKGGSKEPSVKERPTSAGNTSSSGQSLEGSVVHHAEPVPGQITPSSSLQSSTSASSLPKLISAASDTLVTQLPVAQRPLSMTGSSFSRRSVTGFPSLMSSGQAGQKLPNAMYSPRVTNIEDGSTIFNKMLLVQGVCGNPEHAGHLLDGVLRVTYSHKQIPRQEFSVNGGVFKFMAYLVPGKNRITLEFFSSKLKDNMGSVSNQASVLTLFHIPATSSPPLRLALLVASDSPRSIDNTPERTQIEGNGLATAVAKTRVLAQMSQAALAELMNRNDMGLRSFRLEEEWTTGSVLRSDTHSARMRNEPKVHIVQTDRTVAELKALASGADAEQRMIEVALTALGKAIPSAASHTEHVAVIILDSHWDAAKGVTEGHVSAVGGDNNFKVSLLGSQFLWSIPSCLEDIDPTFADCTRIDGKCFAAGVGMASSVWEMADIMLIAYFRNVLRLFGCDEKMSGINSSQKDQHVSRAFVSRESFGMTSKSPGLRCVTREHESKLHKLDALQLRFHGNFVIPPDDFVVSASRAFVWPVKNKNLVITSSAGITYIELFAGTDPIACGFLDYTSAHAARLPNVGEFIGRLRNELTISETALRNALPHQSQRAKLRLVIHSYAAEPTVVPDVSALFDKNESVVKHSKLNAFRSFRVGNISPPGASEEEEVIWMNAVDLHAVMKSVRVYFDDEQIYGLEIVHVDSEIQLFGTRGEDSPLGASNVQRDIIQLDTRLAETPTGFVIWTSDSKPIQGIQIVTSKGMYSPRYGNTRGANQFRALAPLGYSLAGLSGTVCKGIQSLRLVIKM